jgi:4-hydroxyphenylpyruvate dioxygenase
MNNEKLPVLDFDYVELYVGNAKQAAFYYKNAMGFDLVGYSGPETGVRDRASYLMQQGKIRFVLTSPMHSDSFIAEHIKKHGDGVRDIAFETNDAKKCYELAVQRGAIGVQEPTVLNDEHGTVIKSAVQTYGRHDSLFHRAQKITTAFSFRLLSLNHIQTALQNARCLPRLTTLSAM